MPVYLQTLERARKHGSLKLETVHRRRDGTCFPVEINIRCVHHDREYLLAVVRDISERKEYEKALRESDERFRNAFDFSAMGIALVSLDGQFLRVNQSLCDIVGYTAEELLAIKFQAITHPGDLDASMDWVHELIGGSVPYCHFEKRYLHKHGHVVWIQLSVSLMKDGGGTPLYFISQFQDITARKQAEEELRRQQEQLTELALVSPAAICTYRLRPDGTACMPYASPSIHEVYGLPAAELAVDMTPALALIHPEDQAKVVERITESMQTMSHWYCEYRVLNPVKGEIWIEGRSAPIREPDGSISLAWISHRRDRSQTPRRTASPGREIGGDRSTCRRNCPRFQ